MINIVYKVDKLAGNIIFPDGKIVSPKGSIAFLKRIFVFPKGIFAILLGKIAFPKRKIRFPAGKIIFIREKIIFPAEGNTSRKGQNAVLLLFLKSYCVRNFLIQFNINNLNKFYSYANIKVYSK